MPGVLGRITRERVAAYAAEAVEPAGPVDAAAPAFAPTPGSLAAALRAPGVGVIAEIKRSSPSQGAIRGPIHELGSVGAARAYAAAGAAAISVLTEPTHFGGDLGQLREVAAAVALPTLRKDFVVHPQQLREARVHGAGAALLIVAVLGERTGAYLRYAKALGLDALVEVHDAAELDVALAAGATIVGVNNRDLRTLDIDLATAPALLEAARGAGFTGLGVAESGYRTADEVRALHGVADAVLVGTSVAASGDLERAVSALVRAGAVDAAASVDIADSEGRP